ncbi:hypothetical protein [Colwellia sp. E2M01]|uniref:hypothetical protein n=1 Tax=Colwellia sp. E2M01 TaxID=2841561 RepID=UPI001C084018|nr:hypothetical protein [Colwellia sp. E2M01]MBU2870000.1 hypothetical protein [Colwellia sp. E2M01]
MKHFFKVIGIAILALTLSSCVDEEDDSYSEDTYSNDSSNATFILGTWKLTDPDPSPVVATISFNSNGRGQNVIDGAGIYASETRGYDYKIEGDDLYFRYDELGYYSDPSNIISVSSTQLKLYHADNTTGTYLKVSSTGSGSDSSSGSGSNNNSCDDYNNIGASIYLLKMPNSSTEIVGSVDIYIDGGYVGYLGSYFNEEPCYGQESTLNVDLSYGTHSIRASGYDNNGAEITWASDNFTLSSSSPNILYGLQF